MHSQALPSQHIRVTPRFLVLQLSPAEELAVDEAAERAGWSLAEVVRWRDPRTGLYDLAEGAGALDGLADATLGRWPARIVHVEGLVPFDFSSFPGRDGLAALEAALPGFPGYLPGPGMYRFFGRDERVSPYLWASHEQPGLHVAGLLPEASWTEWASALDRVTASWPRRG